MVWLLIAVLLVMLGPGPHLAQLLVLLPLWGGVCLVLGWLLRERS